MEGKHLFLVLISAGTILGLVAAATTNNNSNNGVTEIRSLSEWYNRVLRSPYRSNDTLHVVQFYVPWCGYCQMIKPGFARLARSHRDVKFFSVNSDNMRYLSEKWGISAVPTFKFLKSGRVMDTISTPHESVLNDMITRLKN